MEYYLQSRMLEIADTEDKAQLLRANNTECLLLSCGKYLVSEKLLRSKVEFLGAIIHEDIEALMQVLARGIINEDDRNTYQAIKEFALRFLPALEKPERGIESHVNHTVARIFQWHTLVSNGLVTERDIPFIDKRLLDIADKTGMLGRRATLFAGEFWDCRARGEKIRKAINKGQVFYQAASGTENLTGMVKKAVSEEKRNVEVFVSDQDFDVITAALKSAAKGQDEMTENMRAFGEFISTVTTDPRAYTGYKDEEMVWPTQTVYRVKTIDLTAFIAHLPRLAEICKTPDMLAAALKIEAACAGVSVKAETIVDRKSMGSATNAYNCPAMSDEPGEEIYLTKLYAGSFLGDLGYELGEGHDERIMRFIRWCESAPGFINRGQNYLRKNDYLFGSLQYSEPQKVMANLAGMLRDNALPEMPGEFAALVTSGADVRKPLKKTLRKCLVLDCDGVLWKGILGESGMDGIIIDQDVRAFQERVLALKNRGILLAINSKNNERDVLKVLNGHPGMLLREDDFVAIKANWDMKSSNMSAIAEELNIGTDSMVFIDDRPHERELVRMTLPEIFTPDIPESHKEMAGSLPYLADMDSPQALTDEDIRRSELYAQKKQRERLRQASVTVEAFYTALGMEITVREGAENTEYVTRMSELTSRVNQFNLTGVKRTESEVMALLNGRERVFTVELEDRYGNAGVIGLIVLKERNEPGEWEVETFCMSCRAIGYGIEYAFMSTVLDAMEAQGAGQIVGIYRPTNKNGLVKDLYAKLGFEDITGASTGAYTWVSCPGKSTIEMPPWIKIKGIKTNRHDRNTSVPAGRDNTRAEHAGLQDLAENLFARVRAKGLDDSLMRNAFDMLCKKCEDSERIRKFLVLENAVLGQAREITGVSGEYETTATWCDGYQSTVDSLAGQGYEILWVDILDRVRENPAYLEILYKIYYARIGKAARVSSAYPIFSYYARFEPHNMDRIYEICILRGGKKFLRPQARHWTENVVKHISWRVCDTIERIINDHKDDDDMKWKAYLDQSWPYADTSGNDTQEKPRGVKYGVNSEMVKDNDGQNMAMLALDVLNAQLSDDRIYRILYDETLSEQQKEIIEAYAARLSEKCRAKVTAGPFRRCSRGEKHLINVYCKSKEGALLGEGHVDIKVNEGDLSQYAVRVTGLINIALAAASIPLTGSDAINSGNIIGFIIKQCREITGRDIEVPRDFRQAVLFLRDLRLNLPEAYKMPVDKIDEFNRRALAAVVYA